MKTTKSLLLSPNTCLSLAAFVITLTAAPILCAADAAPSAFDGSQSTWHDDFVRYDYIMDDETLEITPFTRPGNDGGRYGVANPPAGKRRCIVVVPKKPASGNPWSWQGCYWDHRSQAEVELLRRGFCIAFITPNPGKQWDAWYTFLTEKHGLSKKPVFVGMSRGGSTEYQWATSNPDKVSGIYGDNPAISQESLLKLAELARRDVPLLNICGSEDFILESCTKPIENAYRQVGGRITVMIKEGPAHHPHSLQDPKIIADFLEQSATNPPNPRPDFLDNTYVKSYYYSTENSYLYLPREDTYAVVRGPQFTPTYDRYDKAGRGFGNGGPTVLVPKTAADGKPWVLRADRIDRTTSPVDLALLARGFYIVVPPLLQQRGSVRADWDAVYKLMTNAGFAKKAVLEGMGAGAGEAYGWAVNNADKVACIYAENPVLRSLMLEQNYNEDAKVPHVDDLSPLATAGVPILHVCGSLDPWLDRETRPAEKKYQSLGGTFTVIFREGDGHFLDAKMDTKPVVDFIIGNMKK
jgi:pimeloyl-ACP methyl ester carboxylesterase